MRALIIGKGKSAHPIGEGDYKIACLNNTTIFVDGWIDYLFVNDLETFQSVPRDDMKRVGHLIMPRLVHIDKGASKIHYKDVLDQFYISSDLNDYNFEVSIHRLDSDHGTKDIEYLGKSHSVGTAALAWLNNRGFNEIDYMGFDPEGGHHPIFNNNGVPPDIPTFYKRNTDYFLEIANARNIKLKKV